MSKFGKISIYFFTAVSLVLCNPLMQMLPFQPYQQQVCSNCQQNPFLNLPLEIPLNFATQHLLQQQPLTDSNQCNTPVVTNQGCNVCSMPCAANQGAANDANKKLVNKVLSNPLVQAIMKNYKYQTQTQNMPSSVQPQIVNNYFIIPSEVLLKESKKDNKEDKKAAVKPKQQNSKAQDGTRTDPKPARKQYPSQWKPQCIVTERPQNPAQKNSGHNVLVDAKQKISREKPQQKSVPKDKYTTMKSNQSTSKVIMQEEETPIQNRKNAVQEFFDEYYEKEEINKPQTKRSGSEEVESETNFEKEPIRQNPTSTKQAKSRPKTDKSTKNNEINSNPTQIGTPKYEKIDEPINLSNQPHVDIIDEPVDSLYENKLPKEKRKTRNSDEAIIQNVRNQYPHMPEKLIRDLLFQMKQQLHQNERQKHRESSTNHHYHPYDNIYPMNYNPNFQQLYYPWFLAQQGAGINNGTSTTNAISRRPRRKQKSSRNKKRKGSKSNNNAAVNTAVDAPKEKKVAEQTTEIPKKTRYGTTEISTTDTTTMESLQSTNTPENAKPETNSNLFDNTTPHSSSYVGNAYPDPRLRQLGTEDEIESIDNNGIGWIEDYYPDFTRDTFFDNDFYEAHPEYYDEEILRNERKIPSEEFSQNTKSARRLSRRRYGGQRSYGNSILNQKPRTEVVIIPKSHQELESSSEEIHFQIPPALEAPDFKTIKVKEYRDSEYSRPRYFSEDYDYYIFNEDEKISNVKKTPNSEVKASTYSYSKIPFDSTSIKPSHIIRNKNEKDRGEIETVFANSRIVKYGVPDYIRNAEPTTQETTNISLEDDMKYRYGIDRDGTSIVMAKSYSS